MHTFITFYFPVHLLVDTWFVSIFPLLWIMIMLQWIWVYKCLFKTLLSILWSMYIWVHASGISGLWANFMFSFLRSCQNFSQLLHPNQFQDCCHTGGGAAKRVSRNQNFPASIRWPFSVGCCKLLTVFSEFWQSWSNNFCLLFNFVVGKQELGVAHCHFADVFLNLLF